MCTLVAALRVHPDFPLVVAFNRDERLDRPAAPPRVLVDPPRIVGGVDLEAGGTWFAASADGRVAGVLNRREGEPRDPTKQSRGRLVLDALRARRIAGDFNPYWLLRGDADGLAVVTGGGRHPDSVTALPPGVHVLVSGPDDGVLEVRRVYVGVKLSGAFAGSREAVVSSLQQVLRAHDPPVCVHAPWYGTRSSTIVAIEPGRVARYLHAEGPPCTTPFEDVTRLLGAPPDP